MNRLTLHSLASLTNAGCWQSDEPPSLYIFINSSTRELATIEKYVVGYLYSWKFSHRLLNLWHANLISISLYGYTYWILASREKENKNKNHRRTSIHLSITSLFILVFYLILVLTILSQLDSYSVDFVYMAASKYIFLINLISNVFCHILLKS